MAYGVISPQIRAYFLPIFLCCFRSTVTGLYALSPSFFFHGNSNRVQRSGKTSSMAEVTKYHLLSASNGGSVFAELRRPFSMLKTRRCLLLLSGFFVVFVGFTLVLAFSPSYSNFSPWIHGVLSSSSAANSSSEDFSSSASGRSELPSLSSYYFPDSQSRSRDAVAPPTAGKDRAVPPVKRNPSSSEAGSAEANRPADHSIGQSTSVQSDSSKNSTIGVPAKENGGHTAKAVNVESNFTASLSKKKPESGTGATTAVPAVSVAAGNQSRPGDGASSLANCDLYDGVWVRDESYPLYKPGSCGLIDEHFNCYANRRPDNDYFKFKWKPRGCNLPRFNADHMLNFLRGKRLVFVGDSINRNMWESLICILRTSVKDQSRVFESHGRLQFRTEAVYSFVFKDYNFTVEFFASPFLVRQWEVKGKDGKMKETLRIDLISESAAKFKTADILVFNTGHWWSHWKTSSGKDYYQEGNHVYSELSVQEAFRRALWTWAKWIDISVDPSKTHVIFRGYSHSHFSGGQWNSGGACDNETEPIKDSSYLREYPWKGKVLESTFKKMKTPVTYLNITMLTDFRKDGHPSIYRKRNVPEEERRSPLSFQDCSHWCLPGVPDAWNELLYAELLVKQRQQQQQQSRT